MPPLEHPHQVTVSLALASPPARRSLGSWLLLGAYLCSLYYQAKGWTPSRLTRVNQLINGRGDEQMFSIIFLAGIHSIQLQSSFDLPLPPRPCLLWMSPPVREGQQALPWPGEGLCV